MDLVNRVSLKGAAAVDRGNLDEDTACSFQLNHHQAYRRDSVGVDAKFDADSAAAAHDGRNLAVLRFR